MSQIVTVSDTLYARLKHAAHEQGFENIEQLLTVWEAFEAERQHRKEIVRQIDQVREQMFTIYGEMPDSVEMLRQDRARL